MKYPLNGYKKSQLLIVKYLLLRPKSKYFTFFLLKKEKRCKFAP